MTSNQTGSQVDRHVAGHILPTSANMLGICFAIFSLTRLSGRADTTSLDDCVAVSVLLFLTSTLFAYGAIRSPLMARYEKLADVSFLLGVVSLFVIVFIFLTSSVI